MAVVRVPRGAADELSRLVSEDDGSVAGGLLTVTVAPWDVRFTGAA